MSEWAQKIRGGDLRALARAASGVENRDPAALALLREMETEPGHALIVGVTGPPGAGKSTLVDAMASALRRQGKTIAIIAVDPTSRITGGAILGDRIRMTQHHGDSGVFVRSMATRGSIGGLARATADLVRLMDAAGRDYVIVETVGVGQDEIEIAGLAQVTVVVLVPGMGDDVQAIKAGIMEIADIFAINKSDQPGADRTEQEIKAMLSLAHGRQPAIIKTVATDSKGIDELLNLISATSTSVTREAGSLTTEATKAATEATKATTEATKATTEAAEATTEATKATTEATKATTQATEATTEATKATTQATEATTEATKATEATKVIRSSAKVGQTPWSAAGPPAGLQIDHLGIAVNSLLESIPFYELLGLQVTHTETIPPEKVNIAFLPAGDSRIELLEPASPDSPISKFLERRGPGLHHLALRVPDLPAAVARLREFGARLLNEPRTGAGGHLYVFVHPASTGGILLELIQENSN